MSKQESRALTPSSFFQDQKAIDKFVNNASQRIQEGAAADAGVAREVLKEAGIDLGPVHIHIKDTLALARLVANNAEQVWQVTNGLERLARPNSTDRMSSLARHAALVLSGNPVGNMSKPEQIFDGDKKEIAKSMSVFAGDQVLNGGYLPALMLLSEVGDEIKNEIKETGSISKKVMENAKKTRASIVASQARAIKSTQIAAQAEGAYQPLMDDLRSKTAEGHQSYILNPALIADVDKLLEVTGTGITADVQASQDTRATIVAATSLFPIVEAARTTGKAQKILNELYGATYMTFSWCLLGYIRQIGVAMEEMNLNHSQKHQKLMQVLNEQQLAISRKAGN